MNHRYIRSLWTVAVLPLCVIAAGCGKSQYQELAGAPDGAAELLAVGSGRDPLIRHIQGRFLKLVHQPNRVVLVDFWGPHCGPCLHLAPELEKIARAYPMKVSVVKVDVESTENEELTAFFGINTIPEVRIFVGGRPAGAIHGYVDARRINRQLESVLSLLDDTSES
ncbi:MAG: thioredoxin domain-containing protein [Fuerstiella sp.]|nr:thioredoxin domain-containing protein [Fuerstiella sp.]